MARSDLRRALAVAASALLVLLFTPSAHAQRDLGTPLGSRGTLSIDQLSGFRMSGVGTGGGTGAGLGVNYGVEYAGIIGFSIQNVAQDIPATNPTQTTTLHYTSFWLAPSADYFVIDHLSIGGLIQVATTSASLDVPLGGTGTATQTLPSTTSFTLLPRVGWMFAISDHFGIWPRLGLGFGSHSAVVGIDNANAATTDSFSSFIMDLDCGFLYRVNENWFLKGTPELTLAPGSHSRTAGNVTVSEGERVFQFGVVGGIGVMWNLL
jgi:hypothetical protein